jgi:enoyl-CoA hydratase/carnithine racemase
MRPSHIFLNRSVGSSSRRQWYRTVVSISSKGNNMDGFVHYSSLWLRFRNGSTTTSTSASASAGANSSTSTPSEETAKEDAGVDDKVLISHDEVNKIVTITLNCPTTYNALTVEMGHTFRTKLSILQNYLHDGSIKNANVCILRGAGKAFSSGGKLDWLHSRRNVPAHVNADIMLDFYKSYLTSLRSLQLPTIAAIHGPAIGAGACLALACDLRVMTCTTNIGFNFVSLGIHSGMGASHFLPKTIGRTAANHVLLTGQILNGTQACNLGLVNRLVDTSDQVFTEATALAKEIAHQNPLAIRRYVRRC